MMQWDFQQVGDESMLLAYMAAAYEKLAERAKIFSSDTTSADRAADPTKSRPDD